MVYKTPKQVVLEFFEFVRSGRQPDRAAELMATHVLAHQFNSEKPETVERTPQNYADHVREMLDEHGNFTLEVDECIAEEDRVYVRWKQFGKHIIEIDGFAPTGKEVIQFASAVYRVHQGKIVEYWIQIDRAGLTEQFKRQEN